VAQQQEGRITEALIDFAKLPPAGTPYTLKITVTGNNAQASLTITVDNSQGANSPKDTRDTVIRALNQSNWSTDTVGDTKLRVTKWDRPAGGGQPAMQTDIRKITVEDTGLKDGQKPTYSLTRVAPPSGSGLSSSVGGTWVFGFAANDNAATLPDDVQMTIRLSGASGTNTVVVTLTAGMLPEDANQAVADQLFAAGYPSFISREGVQYDDPNGTLDSVEIEYTALGASPVVSWLTESVSFEPLG
jgi:hypothetical protein